MLMMTEGTGCTKNSYELLIEQLERRDHVEQELLLEKQAQAEATPQPAGPNEDRTNADGDSGGTAVVPSDKRPSSRTGERNVTVEATAYTAKCDGCIGITKTGVDVRDTTMYEGRRVIAVDPSVIPLGSDVTLTFEDGRTMKATAQDVGGAINGREIDILVDSRSTAIDFGRQPVKVTIN